VYLRPAKKRQQAAQVQKLPFVEGILAERAKTHGKFVEVARIAQAFKEVMRNSEGWQNLSPSMRESLEMQASKKARIIAGNPTHKDSWIDIEGYAHLVSERLS
jgi:hypothetical protein